MPKPRKNRFVNTRTRVRMRPMSDGGQTWAQSLAMSLPFAFQIWSARDRIASTADLTVVVDVRNAVRRRRALNAFADSRPPGALLSMRLLMSFQRLKSNGIKSGEQRGHAIVFILQARFAAMPLPLLYPLGSLSSAIK